MSSQSLPLNYGVVVFPGFQALDVFGPLDALNNFSFSNNIQLSIVAPSLDPVSTETHLNVNATCAQSIVPTHTFDNPPGNLDVLIVPGGFGCHNNDPSTLAIVDYVKAAYPSLKYLITVCTGATIAARTGVLDGRRATSNKMHWEWTTSQGPKVKWVTHARWVVDGNIWTAAGVSAGTDVMLAFMEHVYGAKDAESVADMMEYERPTDSTKEPFATKFGLTPMT
ncbi:class I glutamine amidotransferase-like protein [Hymenopellis radicata]|nr:class I glutamine amidotransferase-like protein [Hymenopellis radicata]